MKYDKDIAELDLSDFEKNGVQFYLNFERKIGQYKINEFCKKIDEEDINIKHLDIIFNKIINEDMQIIPLLICSFADDCLNEMLIRECPGSIVGGRESLFGQYGPMSSLFSRLQLSCYFDLINVNLINDINYLRKIRNKIAHSWDGQELNDYFLKKPVCDITNIENIIAEDDCYSRINKIDAQSRVRIRFIWLVIMIYYECKLYSRAKKFGLIPFVVLYGENKPKLLAALSRAAYKYTDIIIEKCGV